MKKVYNKIIMKDPKDINKVIILVQAIENMVVKPPTNWPQSYYGSMHIEFDNL